MDNSPFSPPSRIWKGQKDLLWGLPGTGKSWAALHAQKPMAVIDLEGRASIYSNHFEFDLLKTDSVPEVKKAIKFISQNQGLYKTLVIDSLTVYWHKLQKHWSKIFLDRNPPSYSQHKQDFYDFGPREWSTVKNDWNSMFEFLMVLDINLVCIARETEKLRSVGGQFVSEGPKPDCEKGTPYLFDRVLHLYKGVEDKLFYATIEKDCLDSLGTVNPIEITSDWLSKYSLPQYVVENQGGL